MSTGPRPEATPPDESRASRPGCLARVGLLNLLFLLVFLAAIVFFAGPCGEPALPAWMTGD